MKKRRDEGVKKRVHGRRETKKNKKTKKREEKNLRGKYFDYDITYPACSLHKGHVQFLWGFPSLDQYLSLYQCLWSLGTYHSLNCFENPPFQLRPWSILVDWPVVTEGLESMRLHQDSCRSMLPARKQFANELTLAKTICCHWCHSNRKVPENSVFRLTQLTFPALYGGFQ